MQGEWEMEMKINRACDSMTVSIPTRELIPGRWGPADGDRNGIGSIGPSVYWVVRNANQMGMGPEEEWMPDGFEERTKEKGGLIIRGWARQLVILNHPAIGGFVTHCGWNSVLESMAAGVPMVTWPLSGEQFYNEKLITRVLRFGVKVGAQVWSNGVEGRPVMGREEIKRAVAHLMDGGDEANERKQRVSELGKGGSSKEGCREGLSLWQGERD